MAIAAIPAYLLEQKFNDASPGMRFGMYLPVWTNNTWGKEKAFPKSVTTLSKNDQSIMAQLSCRQMAAFDSISTTGNGFILSSNAVAPFTTGLGNEHPLENGFAFLNPYGLPYLPGSGVKGVLRQAARELASGDWGDDSVWNDKTTYKLIVDKKEIDLSIVDALFGLESKEGDTQHVRGALTFWDVIPQIKGDNLSVEIMTPHQSHYYQEKKEAKSGNSISPHDSGQPVPISFLTIPPGSGFTFYVQCNLEHLQRIAPALAENTRWKSLLQSAFEHAFDWLGFGAKTAVGYGQMKIDASAERKREEIEKQQTFAAMSPCDRAIIDIQTVQQTEQKLNRKQAGGPLDSVITDKLKEATGWDLEDKQKLAEMCREAMKWLGKDKKKIKEKLAVLNLPVV